LHHNLQTQVKPAFAALASAALCSFLALVAGIASVTVALEKQRIDTAASL
jgi:hypothetical protein